MTPIFLAFHNAAGETAHVVLPRAVPHATTHLPNDYVDSIDLSVFRSDSHSIVRLRTFDEYVLLSVLPDAKSKVYVLTPLGGQVLVAPSTHLDTPWFILLDGTQFTYAALRCSVEFDHDHSISDSMRPPEVPRPVEHVSVFEDKDMLPDLQDPVTGSRDDPGLLEALTEDTHRPHVADSLAQASSLDKESIMPAQFVNGRKLYKISASNTEPKSLMPLAMLETAPLQENLNLASPSRPRYAADVNPEPTEIHSLGTHQLKIIKDRYSCQQLKAEPQASQSERSVIKIHRKAGEESQTLDVINSKSRTHIPSRKSGEESQVFEDETAATSKKTSTGPTRLLKDVQAKNSAFVNRILEDNPQTLKTDGRSRGSCTPDTTEKDHKSGSSNVSSSRLGHTQSLKSSAPSIPRKRSVSEFFGRDPAPSKTQTRLAAQTSDTESCSSDVSRTSISTLDALPKSPNMRRQSLRSGAESIDIPKNPVIVFSTKCTIQNKKGTMKTLSELGGTLGEDISEADMLCVPHDDLKKTSKLILAVILGKIIVTEDWVIQSARQQRFLDTNAYQPRDKSQAQEWGVKLPEALNQGRYADKRIDQLFQDHKLYLTQQLQDQLRKTDNLESFIKIGTAMGAAGVRKRLPVKRGPKMIVLGVLGDFDAMTVGRLGFPLYDKDLLIMSALRGERQDRKEEFQIDIPIKEEQFSQS